MQCLVLVLTTNPSDIRLTKTLFLDLRKEWQGFKNKVLNVGRTTIKKLYPDQEMQAMGLLARDLEKVSTGSFPHKNA